YRGINLAPLQVTYARPDVGLEAIELFGRRWLKPKDHDLALTALYGDWRGWREDWETNRDSPSIVAREPWAWTSALGHHDGNLDEYLGGKGPPAEPARVGLDADGGPVTI
ncbi:MAG: hypothetical protein ACRDZX_14580, partial [Acidimicrobiales bacterium]